MTGRWHSYAALIVASLWTFVPEVDAQVVAAPPRTAVTAPPAGPLRQEASVTGSLLGGYDEDTSAFFAGPIEGVAINGANIFGDLAVRYAVTNGPHSVQAIGRGYVNSYPTSDVEPGYGAESFLRVGTGIGRTGLELSGRLRYEPFYSLGVFGPLGEDIDVSSLPDSNPITGLSGELALTTEGSVALTRQWSRRQATTARYLHIKRDRQGAFGRDLTASNAQLGHTYVPSRSLSVTMSYAYARTEFQELEGPSAAGELLTHSSEVLVSRTIRLSPSRSVMLSVGGGADYVDGILDLTGNAYNYWAPVARGTLQVDVGRDWTVAGDYRRSVVALDGVSGQSFPSHIAFVRAGGPLFGRLSTAFNGGYAGGSAGLESVDQQFRTLTGTAQLSFAMTRRWGLVLNYTVFDNRFSGTIGEEGALPEFRRSSVRAGLSMLWPVTRPRPGEAAAPRRR